MSLNENTTEYIEQEGNDLNLLETLITYLRYFKWYVLSVILCMGMAYLYIRFTIPQYKIETDLLIKDNKADAAGQNDLLKSLDLFTSDKIIDNEIEILKSNSILTKVIDKLKLNTSYFLVGRVRQVELYLIQPFTVQLLMPNADSYNIELSIQLIDTNYALVNGKKVLLGKPYNSDAGIVLIEKNPAAEAAYLNKLFNVKFTSTPGILLHYSENLKINPVSKQGTVLVITVEDAIPERGKDFLNSIVEAYDNAAVEDKNKVTSNTLSFIDEELKRISTELGSVEKDVEQFKSNNRITDISSQSQIFLQGVKDNDSELSKVLIQLNVLGNLENYLRNNQDDSAKLPSTLGVEDPTLLGLVSKLGESELKRESMLQTIPASNPIVTSLNDQINALKSAINSTVQNLERGLQITKDQLQSKNNQFETTIRQVPLKERGLLDVMRQQEIKNALFTYLLQKREETAMQLASGVADSRIIDYAKSSPSPVKPVRRVVYLVLFVIALILPTLIIYLKNRLNYKITRRLDIERFTKTPILTEISQSDDHDPLLVTSKPRSMIAEQIRVLRTNLQFVIPSASQKVILFTSSISGEGKSFISLNLGASLAMTGKKVIILELDLRKPRLHSGLEIDNEFGLSNFLIGRVELKDILKSIPAQKDYFIITSGPIPPNPAELLSNGRIQQMIEDLKKDFDYIILDAPPVGLVTDAQILGAFADLTLFIIRHNYTAKNNVNAIEDFYKTKKFNNLNIILNAIDLQMGYGSSYGYGYGYGYGGYYHESSNKKVSFFERLFAPKKKS